MSRYTSGRITPCESHSGCPGECSLRQRWTADVSSHEGRSGWTAQGRALRLGACRSHWWPGMRSAGWRGWHGRASYRRHVGCGTRYSQCSRWVSRRLCSSAWTATRMPSSSRAADAHSLISKQIWRVPAPSGAKPVSKELVHYRQLEGIGGRRRNSRRDGKHMAESDRGRARTPAP